MEYCSPLRLRVEQRGRDRPAVRYFGLQLVKPGSRPNRLQSAALGSAWYRAANVCAAKVPISFGKTTECLSQAWKLPALVSTTAHGLKPSA